MNKLSDIGALLYTWMIPYYDDDGRMEEEKQGMRLIIAAQIPSKTGIDGL